MALRKVFVTVGTTKFDKFISTITENEILKILRLQGYEELILQIGNGDYEPHKIEKSSELPSIDWFRFKENLATYITESDLVISHAGAGSCLEALHAGKKLLVVINNLLMDNHQVELASKLHEEGYLFYTTPSNLKTTIETMDLNSLKPYPKTNAKVFAEYVNAVMGLEKEN